MLEKHGADDILPVKDNQPTVKERIAELLDPVGSFSPAAVDPDVSAARTANEGHGRIEVRTAHSGDLLGNGGEFTSRLPGSDGDAPLGQGC